MELTPEACFHIGVDKHSKWVSSIFLLKSPSSPKILTYGDCAVIPEPSPEQLAYIAKDASYFDWIRGSSTYSFDSWLRLIVRAFAEPVVDDFSDQELEDLYHKFNHKQFLDFFSKKVKLVTDDRFLIPGCHKSWWSAEKMGEFMKKAGFRKVLIKSRRDSESQIFRGNKFNNTRPNMSFYIEAIK